MKEKPGMIIKLSEATGGSKIQAIFCTEETYDFGRITSTETDIKGVKRTVIQEKIWKAVSTLLPTYKTNKNS